MENNKTSRALPVAAHVASAVGRISKANRIAPFAVYQGWQLDIAALLDDHRRAYSPPAAPQLSAIALALATNHGEPEEALNAGYLSDAKAVQKAMGTSKSLAALVATAELALSYAVRCYGGDHELAKSARAALALAKEGTP